MTWDPDDFYNESNEFDQQIDEFRQTLLKAVKTNFITKMELLEKDNAELQEVKKNFDQIKRDYKDKERQLENERNQMERKIRNERLNQLMSDFEIILYTARSNRVLPPKCDMCNEKRRIPFTTPLGKEISEECECSVGKQVYYPEEFGCTEFYIDRSGNKVGGIYRKRDYSDDGYRDSGVSPDALYEVGMEYEKLNYYSTYFRSQEECQKYCDWLTEQKEE